MTEFLEKCKVMINSSDMEMVRMGITLLINHATLKECNQIIPSSIYILNSYEDKVGTIRLPEPTFNDMLIWGNNHYYQHIWIKDDKAIAFYQGRIICRRLGLMKVLHDFEKIDKTYFD